MSWSRARSSTSLPRITAPPGPGVSPPTSAATPSTRARGRSCAAQTTFTTMTAQAITEPARMRSALRGLGLERGVERHLGAGVFQHLGALAALSLAVLGAGTRHVLALAQEVEECDGGVDLARR